jgi:hypothetical protein
MIRKESLDLNQEKGEIEMKRRGEALFQIKNNNVFSH